MSPFSTTSMSALPPSTPKLEFPPLLNGEEERALWSLGCELFPIHRTLMGRGVRETVERLQREIPLKKVEVPSGTQWLDWEVPNEWEMERGWIEDSSGRRWVDTADSPLHLLAYSVPIEGNFSLSQLRPHLHTLPSQPNWIPYRTLYYANDWGFALPHSLYEQMEEGEYRVVIRARHFPGSLTYGELFLPGDSEEECLISTYLCHPSLANDNLSGVVVAARLAARLAQLPKRRLSYRFLFLPETIGAIAWLGAHRTEASRIAHGLVATCLGDRGPFTYKRSRQGGALIDRVVEQLLSEGDAPYSIRDYSPMGSDERQYGSPGFNLPVGSLMRTPYGEYPEYHTSADDLSLLSPQALEESLRSYWEVCHRLETNRTLQNLCPYGEPQLGRRGLYDPVGGQTVQPEMRQALLWLLNLSDGSHDLLTIASRSNLAYRLIEEGARMLEARGLLG